MNENFRRMLYLSFKSEDTEEWLDVHFTRPVGLAFALLWNRLGVHPNAITILSMFLGAAAAVMFYHTDLPHNVAGVALLMLANFCDSTDGQMARLSGKKTLIGRMLDGLAGDVWFFCIYAALCLRLMPQFIPGTEVKWGWGIWILAFVAGILCHAPQSSLADYYRQIHLFFLKGTEGSELDSYEQQRAVSQQLPRHDVVGRLFHRNYANYCRRQEVRTPAFQRFFRHYRQMEGIGDRHAVDEVRLQLLEGSRPLMKYANILTFNVRAITLYAACLIGIPWLYFVVEITVLTLLYVYMHRRHEQLCDRLTEVMKIITELKIKNLRINNQGFENK